MVLNIVSIIPTWRNCDYVVALYTFATHYPFILYLFVALFFERLHGNGCKLSALCLRAIALRHINIAGYAMIVNCVMV